MTGGIVSLGPPLGGVVVLAHECENSIMPSKVPTAAARPKVDMCFLLICILLLLLPYIFNVNCIPINLLTMIL